MLRPEQNVLVLRAENDPEPQKVKVRRACKADAGRVIDPREFLAAQQAQYQYGQMRQQAPIGLWGSGRQAQQAAQLSPLAVALGGHL